jgi:hypothetical protein
MGMSFSIASSETVASTTTMSGGGSVNTVVSEHSNKQAMPFSSCGEPIKQEEEEEGQDWEAVWYCRKTG